MKKFLKALLAVLIIAAVLVAGFCIYSHAVYGRSAMATFVELFLRATPKNRMMNEEQTLAYMEERAKVEDEAFVLPKGKYASAVVDTELFGCQALVFSGSEEPERTVIYMHGGAYVNEMTKQHVKFCDKLAVRINARVIAPVYPLAPNHGYDETYRIVDAIYESERASGKPIIIMGDSAGGGFAAAYCEYLASEGRETPDQAVLLSPWVDVSMSGEGYEEYEATDPMVGFERVKVMGRSWAKDLDVKDPLVSPIFGDVSGMPRTLIFLGTRELLYPDIEQFYENMVSAGCDVKLIVKKGMNHVYPVYPIPEAKEALEQIAEFVENNN